MNLEKILSEKEKIIALVEQFGYSKEVKIYCENPNDKVIHFLVSKASEDSPPTYKARSFLKAMLVEKLDCHVNVIVYQCVKDPYRYDVNIKSANIMDEQALVQLFGSTKVHFADLDEEEKGDNKILLEQAEEYLQKKLETSVEASKKKEQSTIQRLQQELKQKDQHIS